MKLIKYVKSGIYNKNTHFWGPPLKPTKSQEEKKNIER